MIGIVIGWLIAGIILVVLSILMYYYNILKLFGFFAILLLGIVILLASTILFIEWQTKKKLGKPFSEEMKSMFIKLTVISIIIFGLGAIGYYLSASGIYTSDISVINTLLSLLTGNPLLKLAIGLISSLGSIVSWLYVDRSGPRLVLNEITRQQRLLEKSKHELEINEEKIQSMRKDMDTSLEDAEKIEEKIKEELKKE